MVKKLASTDYLKRFENMSAAEQADLFAKIREWSSNSLPLLQQKVKAEESRFRDILQLSMSWNDAECAAFQEGARLLSPFIFLEPSWLPDHLYSKSARRCVSWMSTTLTSHLPSPSPSSPSSSVPCRAYLRESSSSPSAQPPTLNPSPLTLHPSSPSPLPIRPRHIDQYVHLLPEKTQKHAAEVRTLLREIDAARENARHLMQTNAPSDKIAQWARIATKLDDRIRKIYRELDAEWEKLVSSGRVVVDDLGNATVVGPPTPAQPSSSSGESEKTSPSSSPSSVPCRAYLRESSSSPSAQPPTLNPSPLTLNPSSPSPRPLKALRRFLTDTRSAPSEAHIEKWKQTYDELVALAGEKGVTPKVREAARHYNINL